MRSGRCSTRTWPPAPESRWWGRATGTTCRWRRLAERAARVDLIDLDARAARGARARAARRAAGARRRRAPGRHGRDRRRARARRRARRAARSAGGAVRAARLGRLRRRRSATSSTASCCIRPCATARCSPSASASCWPASTGPLVTSVVRRLHASAPGGVVVHVHDPLGWWAGHPQRVTLEEILEAAATDTDAALALVARGHGPSACDPRAIALELGCEPVATALWRWPFQEGVDYLACATVTRPGEPRCTSLPGMDALEQYLSEHYWSEDDLLREVRADIEQRGPDDPGQRRGGPAARAARARCRRDARARDRHALRLQRHLDGARAAAGRTPGHDRDREDARRRRRALVRARRPGRPRHGAPRRRASTCSRRCPAPTTSPSSTPTSEPTPSTSRLSLERLRPGGIVIADNAIRRGRIVRGRRRRGHGRHPRDARPPGRRPEARGDHRAGRRRAGHRRQEELSA